MKKTTILLLCLFVSALMMPGCIGRNEDAEPVKLKYPYTVKQVSKLSEESNETKNSSTPDASAQNEKDDAEYIKGGEEGSSSGIDKSGHSHSYTEQPRPTCSTEGVLVCSCGDTRHVPATGKHEWEDIYETALIHHDETIEEKKIIDREAWDEPVYEIRPVYETTTAYVCQECEMRADDEKMMSVHVLSHEPKASYYIEETKEQTGTQQVQTSSIHHAEEFHIERHITAPYDEEVITGVSGQRCVYCGIVQ